MRDISESKLAGTCYYWKMQIVKYNNKKWECMEFTEVVKKTNILFLYGIIAWIRKKD